MRRDVSSEPAKLLSVPSSQPQQDDTDANSSADARGASEWVQVAGQVEKVPDRSQTAGGAPATGSAAAAERHAGGGGENDLLDRG